MIEAPPGSGPTGSGQHGSGAGDRHLASQNSAPKRPGHTSDLATAPTGWGTRVIGFLDQAIGN